MPKKRSADDIEAEAIEQAAERFFLIKAEPNSRLEKGIDVKFSIDDLKAINISCWDGVRNYEARNIMRDLMEIGDLCLFYHSNTKTPGVVGLAKVCRIAYIDHTAFDSKHPYYDVKSKVEAPKWFMVDVQYVSHLKRMVTLKEMQQCVELQNMSLIKRGRLSIQKVGKMEFDFILKRSEEDSIDINSIQIYMKVKLQSKRIKDAEKINFKSRIDRIE